MTLLVPGVRAARCPRLWRNRMAKPDGSMTVYFGPSKSNGVQEGNWIQTNLAKGWFTLLRVDSPLESFFTKSWRSSVINLVK